MSLVKINVHPRTTKGKNENRRTRAAGHVPAVLYGPDRPAIAVQLERHEFTRALQKAHGRTVIWDLQLDDGSDRPLALMRELQQHPVTDEILHVDLFEIPRGVPVTVHVALVLKGEPQCVKFAEGEVLQLLDGVELSCQPRELPDAIEVDVTDLPLNAKLFVKDLTVPIGEVMNDPETQVLVVKPVSLFVEEAPAVVAEGAEPAETAEDKSDD